MQRRAGLVVLGTAIAGAVLFIVFPRLDIAVSRLMITGKGRFLLYFEGISYHFHLALQYVAPAIVVFCLVAGVAWLCRRPIGHITAWQALYVALVIVIGPGLLVNVVLKDNSHRPRPVTIQDFGGQVPYAPPFDFSGACDENCSFVSGDPAIGFALLAPALLLPAGRRRIGVAAALVLGAALGIMRMLQGAHFLSDVFFCGIVVAATVLLLRWAMFTSDGAPRGRLGHRLSSLA